ncbi:MAG: hypothetical protein V1895_00545 [Parcubacteria group bacterium]
MKPPNFVTITLLALGLLLSGCTRTAALPPDQALVNALAKLIEAKSFSALVESTLDEVPVATSTFNKKFTAVSARLELAYTRHGRGGERLALSATLKDQTGEQLRGELRVVNDQLFFRIDELPDLGELDLRELTRTAFVLPLSGMTPELSALERAAAAKMVKETPDLFTNIEELAEEEVVGVMTRHFRAQLNPDALERLVDQLFVLSGAVSAKPNVDLVSVSEQPLELWVAKQSGSLVRLKGPFEEIGDTSGTLEITWGDFNKRLNIEPLENAVVPTLQELFSRLDATKIPDKTDEDKEESEEESNVPANKTSTQNNSAAPNVDTGNTTTPHVPEVPFPIQ